MAKNPPLCQESVIPLGKVPAHSKCPPLHLDEISMTSPPRVKYFPVVLIISGDVKKRDGVLKVMLDYKPEKGFVKFNQ
jgi:hypothetical protein